jgi:pimeloyl-ACP methyl ester carboxylesterase
MKKLLIAIVVLCAITTANAQDIAGRWQGFINAGGTNIRLIFNITKNADNSYTTTFDSPDQNAFGIKCNRTTLVKDSLTTALDAANISYKGLWDGKDNITGFYKQGPGQVPINLKRAELVRPQTPKPPFNYYTEDVEYDNADKTLHYGATFTRPNGSGKFPAVIIITGSGTQDRDGTLFGHKLYWVLADYLTKNGIAVLRVDDRGAGKSTIGPDGTNVTSETFSHDVETSLNYLETRGDVNKKHLGLIGHSEGGMIAPMVAVRRKDVSFIVLWGAPASGGAKINTEQAGWALRQRGVDSVSAQAYMNLNDQVLPLFKTSTNKEDLHKNIYPVLDKWLNTQSKTTLDGLSLTNDTATRQALTGMYTNLYTTPWLRFFFTYDPATDLSKVTCPVLAINGEKDVQVNAKANLDAVKTILTKSGNKDFEVKELPGLNHLLQDAKTGNVSEYEEIEETMSPQALNIISTWIKLHTK